MLYSGIENQFTSSPVEMALRRAAHPEFKQEQIGPRKIFLLREFLGWSALAIFQKVQSEI
jgi:hypothetical protein